MTKNERLAELLKQQQDNQNATAQLLHEMDSNPIGGEAAAVRGLMHGGQQIKKQIAELQGQTTEDKTPPTTS